MAGRASHCWALVLGAVVVVSRTGGPSRPEFVPLHATAEHAFVQPDGVPVTLKAIDLQPVWPDTTRTWDASRYRDISAKGFNAVRMVVFWDRMEPRRGEFDPQAFAVLDTAVQRASDAGLRIVLDPVHLYGAGPSGQQGLGRVPEWARSGDSVSSVEQNAGPYLAYVAARYRDAPAIAAYDLVNEPVRWPLDQNGVLRMYNVLMAQVRAADPDRIVLLEPTFGNSSIDPRFVDFGVLTDRRNVVWSIHDYYAGGGSAGFDPVTGAPAGSYTWNNGTGYPAPSPAELDEHIRVQVEQLRRAGLPLWVGEFGIDAGGANRDLWIRQKVAVYDKYGIGYCWWEYWSPGALSATTSDHRWQPWVSLVVGDASSQSVSSFSPSASPGDPFRGPEPAPS